MLVMRLTQGTPLKRFKGANVGLQRAALRRFASGMGRVPATRLLIRCLLTLALVSGCEIRAHAQQAASASASSAAAAEWARIQKAEASGARVSRSRLDALVRNYPSTTTAYEVNLELASMDFRAMEAQAKTAQSIEPVKASARQFLARYASGGLTTPPTAELQRRYQEELHPMLLGAVRRVGTWQAALEYLKAFPTGPSAATIDASLERAIVNPNVGWEARDILTAYSEVRPERTRNGHLAAQVETNLFGRLKPTSSVADCEAFLTAYPASLYAETVRGWIRAQRPLEATIHSESAQLRRWIAERPGSLEAKQAEFVLSKRADEESAFRSASASRSVAALERFMADHPLSPFAADADRQIAEIKLAAVSSSSRASLAAFQSDIERRIASERARLLSADPPKAGLPEELDAKQKSVDAVQARLTELRRRISRERGEAARLAKERDALKAKTKGKNPPPNLGAEIKKREAERVLHAKAADKLDKDLQPVAAENARLKEELAVLATGVKTEEARAKALEMKLLGVRNQLHYEYLARLDAAYRAATGT